MIISYNWLCEYLPVAPDPQKLSRILTSIGLEVENLHPYESVKGGLNGVLAGEVVSCHKHPDADKLKITSVNIGSVEMLQIVCGASNVAAGQKVLIAPAGSTIYPVSGAPLQIKKAKIRGAESNGMICAEDELGLGSSHEGIMVLPPDTVPGTPAADIFGIYTDHIFEIGLTPNRTDAMSHLGVARDVCAWLWHHEKKEVRAISPFKNNFKAGSSDLVITAEIADSKACRRYSGITVSNITVSESPAALQDKLRAIGIRPINNIVDITNFVLHETGQPLHAFDADKIAGRKLIIRRAFAGEVLTTLDEKPRALLTTDLVIADAEKAACIAGVYGGLAGGVTSATKNIFLESATFDAQSIRRTSLAHGLRTDAAARFEKGTDISNTVNVLKRAALLVKELAGGEISSDIVDIYPAPAEKVSVSLPYRYLKKLSGKNYHAETIKQILTALGFDIRREGADEISVDVPFSKTDISIPADIVEEIMRIDGLDNIEIPALISISPASDPNAASRLLREKTAGYLSANGFSEIFTNSISAGKYYDDGALSGTVKMINSLSADLDVMRPSILESGLEVIAYNINRKNSDLKLYEFGKSYHESGVGKYAELDHLAVYLSGSAAEGDWKRKAQPADFFYIKGICEKIFRGAGVSDAEAKTTPDGLTFFLQNREICTVAAVPREKAAQFGIKEQVFFADIRWAEMLEANHANEIIFSEISKFPPVQRDLAVVVDKNVTYAAIEQAVRTVNLPALGTMRLFDIFESEKIGIGKRSVALSFTFSDDKKTLADADTDAMVNKIIRSLEKNIGGEIRK